MSISRYKETDTIFSIKKAEPKHLVTYDLPSSLKGYANIDWFENMPYHQHVWTLGDRIDKLASKYYGEDEYWWVIALVNNITYPLGIPFGTVIKIPSDVNSVLRILNLR